MLYEQTKRDLAARTWKDIQNYADAKTEVIQEIVARARRNQVYIARIKVRTIAWHQFVGEPYKWI